MVLKIYRIKLIEKQIIQHVIRIGLNYKYKQENSQTKI